MKTILPLQNERLFEPFHDPVDGVLCVDAWMPAARLFSASVGPSGFPAQRFPLLLDGEASLREHLEASTHASASNRFGPYCDNVLGMNWRLPSGKVARIGERVVKSTTGYDWLRFLLHSGSRFGEPMQYVVRLRPACGFHLQAAFTGGEDALARAARLLLHSAWMHWWESVDALCEGDALSLRVGVHCPEGEAALFESELHRIASVARVGVDVVRDLPPSLDGLPDAVLKTTPDRAFGLARSVARALASEVRGMHAARGAACVHGCVALLYCGVVHVHLGDVPEPRNLLPALLQPHLAELHALGGDWHSRHLPASPTNPSEEVWLKTLEEALHA